MAPPPAPVNWESRYKEQLKECERLRAELKQVTEERDGYLKSLYACLPWDEIEFTKEEVFASLGQHPTIDEIIEGLEKRLGS